MLNNIAPFWDLSDIVDVIIGGPTVPPVKLPW